MSDNKARSEREAFEAWFRKEKGWFELPLSLDTGEWDAWQARASLDANAGQAEPTEWSRTRSNLATTMCAFGTRPDGKRGMDAAAQALDAITEPGSPLSWLRNAVPLTANQAECAYALIGRQLISSGLYDRMTDADSDDEAAGLISELVSVVDPILSTNAAPMTADQTDAARIRELELQVESLTKQRNEAHNAAHANATLKDRAVALLRGMEWANNRWADCCPECEAAKTGPHYAGCGIGSFIAEIERLDRAEGKS
jgi:hypothetical protein